VLLLLAAALGACTQSGTKAPPSRHVRTEFTRSFHTVASAEQLGAAWTEAGGGSGVRSVWADADGERALIVLRGVDAPALWVGGGDSAAMPVALEHAPAYVDAQAGIAYAVEAGQLLERSLPEGEWEVRFGTDSAMSQQIIAAAGHPAAPGVWTLLESAPLRLRSSSARTVYR